MLLSRCGWELTASTAADCQHSRSRAGAAAGPTVCACLPARLPRWSPVECLLVSLLPAAPARVAPAWSAASSWATCGSACRRAGPSVPAAPPTCSLAFLPLALCNLQVVPPYTP